MISRCRCAARRGIDVSCVAARRKIYTICDNAASDIAATAAKISTALPYLRSAQAICIIKTKSPQKFQARKILRSEWQRNKNDEIKGDMFKPRRRNALCIEKIKFEVKIGGERQRVGKFKAAASRD